jgi:hypothetical protein
MPLSHKPQLLPQSTPVSVPLCTSSLQVASWQNGVGQASPSQSVLEAEHTPSTQSASFSQSRPGRHGAHGPPQSTSASVAFFTPSSQVGIWHVPSLQAPLKQSLCLSHGWPIPQGGQPPPQSMPVSAALSRPSEHTVSSGSDGGATR